MDKSMCVNCGAEGIMMKGLCPACYGNRHTIFTLDENYTVDRCPRCGQVRVGKGWKDLDHDVIDSFIKGKVRVTREASSHTVINEIEDVDEYNISAVVTVRAEFDPGFVVESNKAVLIHLDRVVCSVCSRKANNYYEAIVQIRGEKPLSDGEVAEIEEEVEKFVNPLVASGSFFISKVEKQHSGIDLYVSSPSGAKNIVKHIVSIYGGETVQSYQAGGRVDGKDVFRKTILVRIPKYKRGDVFYHKGQAYVISRVRNRYMWLINLLDFRTRRTEAADLKKGRCMSRSDAVSDAVVVFQSAGEVEIMDPVTYEQRTLVKPENYRINGETVPIVKIEGEIYLYPVSIDV